jgi:hypothetical protein
MCVQKNNINTVLFCCFVVYAAMELMAAWDLVCETLAKESVAVRASTVLVSEHLENKLLNDQDPAGWDDEEFTITDDCKMWWV